MARDTSRATPVGQIVRPTAGWLRTLRDALGITLSDLAHRLKITPPAVRSFEQAEAEDRITLGSLRRTADAMGCELIYALVPRTGSLAMLAETKSTATGHQPAASAHSPPASSAASEPASKVTDKTWHALHGES